MVVKAVEGMGAILIFCLFVCRMHAIHNKPQELFQSQTGFKCSNPRALSSRELGRDARLKNRLIDQRAVVGRPKLPTHCILRRLMDGVVFKL